MKKPLIILVLNLLTCFLATAQTDAAINTDAWHWGFSGTIEMGGMSIGGTGLDKPLSGGYGSVSRDSVIALFSFGGHLRKPELVDFRLAFSFMAGGSFVWTDLFGFTGQSFSLFSDSLAIQVEVEPVFSFLQGIQPFIGAGYSLTNGLVDDFGDGFVRGRGLLLTGGLDIFNSFGLSLLPFSTYEDYFFGLRLSVYYRFPYEYSFKINWKDFAENYNGQGDPDAIMNFFATTFPAESFSFGVGLTIGGTPGILKK